MHLRHLQDFKKKHQTVLPLVCFQENPCPPNNASSTVWRKETYTHGLICTSLVCSRSFFLEPSGLLFFVPCKGSTEGQGWVICWSQWTFSFSILFQVSWAPRFETKVTARVKLRSKCWIIGGLLLRPFGWREAMWTLQKRSGLLCSTAAGCWPWVKRAPSLASLCVAWRFLGFSVHLRADLVGSTWFKRLNLNLSQTWTIYYRSTYIIIYQPSHQRGCEVKTLQDAASMCSKLDGTIM